jgi:hypothetical protein
MNILVRKTLEISWSTEWIVAFQEGLCSLHLVVHSHTVSDCKIWKFVTRRLVDTFWPLNQGVPRWPLLFWMLFPVPGCPIRSIINNWLWPSCKQSIIVITLKLPEICQECSQRICLQEVAYRLVIPSYWTKGYSFLWCSNTAFRVGFEECRNRRHSFGLWCLPRACERVCFITYTKLPSWEKNMLCFVVTLPSF